MSMRLPPLAAIAAFAFTAMALAAVAVMGVAASASAAPHPPADLQVEGGEEAWHAKRAFRVDWRNPAPSGAPPVVAVHYRVRYPSGAVTVARRIGWPASSVEGLEVPGPPGAYTVEVWLEDATGETGAPATARLRYDDERPAAVAPLVASTWIGRSAFPLPVRLRYPGGATPVSGIRGYAVSLAPTPDRPPCAAANRCGEAEIDLSGGIANDTHWIADLPEGTGYVQAVAVSGSGMASTPERAVLRVDKTSPVTRLGGARADWANHPVRLKAVASDAGSGMLPGDGGLTPFTAIAIDGAAPTIEAGAAVEATVIGEGVHRIAYYARDLAGNVDDGAVVNGKRNPAPATVVVRIDRGPPSVSFLGAQDASDPELIRARVADPLAGPDSGRGWIGVRRAGSGDPFAPLPPAPAPSGQLRARWPSESYAAGEYEFRAIGYDAAGNATATTLRADGNAMVLSSPLKASTTLRAGLDRIGGGPRGAIPYGRGATFAGRLTVGVGESLGGMPVRIVERFGAGSPAPPRVTTTRTAADGSFALRLFPGPSREVAASFEGTPTLTRSASEPARLGVRSGVLLKASAKTARVGGAPVVFRGRVLAPPGGIPSGGKSVQLQFRLPGLPWSEFRTVQTDRRGRFRYAYRFSDDDSRGVRFRFRAYAPAQGGWPYEPNGSRPVAVRGT